MPESPAKILVVDDEPDLELLIRQRFRRQIRASELSFTFAGDGVAALDVLAADREIDIVLTDINMPRMDGLTLLGRLQELDRVLKVVIVSAYGDLDNIRTAMNRGAFDFITKPINFEDLEITLRKTYQELFKLKEGLAFQRQFTALQRELEIARKIQLSALPTVFPAFPERTDFDLYATMLPAQEVGGDFYDFFLVDDRRLGFVLGDVSGKGIGAALFMAITRTMLRATALGGLPPEVCLTHVNRVLFPETMSRMFVTVFYGILDTQTGEVAYANAGHHAPYLVRCGGAVEAVPRTGGLALCLTRDFAYRAGTVVLGPGDGLFVYSDGVTEAVDVAGEQFGDDRLAEAVAAVGTESPHDAVHHVRRALTAFAAGARQHDDVTMLALKVSSVE